MAVETVTSENLEAFNAARMPQTFEDLEKIKEAPKADESKAVEADEPEPGDDEPEEKPRPKKKGIEGRFSELTTKNRQAIEAKEAAERRADAAEAKAKEYETKLNPPKQNESKEPNPRDFTDAYDYAKALAKWEVKEALSARDKQEVADRAQKEVERSLMEFHKRVETAKAEIPDYDDTLASADDLKVNDDVKDAIIESAVGPYILHHLASNPELVDKINGMTVRQQLREIGKLENKIESAKSKEEDVGKEVRPKVILPAPISPLKRGSSADNPVNATGEFTGSYAQWKQARMAGKV